MRKSMWGAFAVCLTLPAIALGQGDDQAAAKALVDKAIKASGGAEKLTKNTGITFKGTGKAEEGGMTVSMNHAWSLQDGDKFRAELGVEVMGMTHNMVMIVDCDKGWMQANGMTMDAPKEAIDMFKDVFQSIRFVQRLVPLTAKEVTLSPLGEVKVGDRATMGVRAGRKDKSDINLYFDKETGLLAKVEMRFKNPESNNEESLELLLSDYKDFDGFKHCSKMVMHKDGKKFFETDVTDVKLHEKLDASLFAKP